MPTSKIILLVFALFSVAVFSACEKDVVTTFGVNDVDVLDGSLNKDKAKTNKQYISILYTTLKKQAIASSELVKTERVIESFGDKNLIHEIIISNYMNAPDVLLPTDSLMRSDLNDFIIDTYKIFYVRIPTEIEVSFFRNYLEANPDVGVELMYMAFASSDEFQFY
jgi:hypothetical protein